MNEHMRYDAAMQMFDQALRAAGAKDRHAARIWSAWLRGKPLDERAGARDLPFPRSLLAELPRFQAHLDAVARISSEHAAADDAGVRFLIELAGGMSVESVLLLRGGVCVSTQVGCAVGCVFCMTGRSGLLRQLSSMEILAQVALARARRDLRRVVFMGMGEPAHNLDNVLAAIEALGTYGELPHKNLVFSTVGDRRAFERLSQSKVKPALALSLHTTDASLREHLLPRAPQIAPAELIELAEAYARLTTYPVQYQWTLLEGINDGDDELERLTELMRGKYGVVNFIPYNKVDGLAYTRPSLARARTMVQHLHSRGILTKLRYSVGQDVDGACGQLRARSLAEPERTLARGAL